MNYWLIGLLAVCVIGGAFIIYDAVYCTVEGPEDEDGNDFAALNDADRAFLQWVDDLKKGKI